MPSSTVAEGSPGCPGRVGHAIPGVAPGLGDGSGTSPRSSRRSGLVDLESHALALEALPRTAAEGRLGWRAGNATGQAALRTEEGGCHVLLPKGKNRGRRGCALRDVGRR